MVAEGRIHYVLVGSAFSSLGFGNGSSLLHNRQFLREIVQYLAELRRHPGELRLPSVGNKTSGSLAVDQWVQTHGARVLPTSYGGDAAGNLYYVSPASVTS
jgi:hypothetical protein